LLDAVASQERVWVTTELLPRHLRFCPRQCGAAAGTLGMLLLARAGVFLETLGFERIGVGEGEGERGEEGRGTRGTFCDYEPHSLSRTEKLGDFFGTMGDL
jgi:hypothetical protein